MGDAEGARNQDQRKDAVAALRAAALDRLREAEASRGGRRFEGLVWSALDLLDRARTLSAAGPAGSPRPVPTGKKEESPCPASSPPSSSARCGWSYTKSKAERHIALRDEAARHHFVDGLRKAGLPE